MLPQDKTIFSGIQPSGELHLGNYLGAIKPWTKLQEQNRCFFCIVDYHAITVPYAATALPERVRGAAVDYLACGLDPARCTIFVQSQVPAHTELAWMLNTLTPLGELERMTQFKDKAEQHRGSINAGLFTYPVLMAADILLYHADLVPVGEDQYQHIELTRLLASKFNATFGQYFPEPRVHQSDAPRVMSLADPTKKMSKSYGPSHYLALADSPDTIRQKIVKAVTDEGGPSDNRLSGGRNLLDLFKVLSNDKAKKNELEDLYRDGKLKYAEFKPLLTETIIKVLAPIQAKRRQLEAQPEKVKEILESGRQRANQVASKTLREVKERMGLA